MAKGFIWNTGLDWRGSEKIDGCHALHLVRTRGRETFCTGIQVYWNDVVWRLSGIPNAPEFGSMVEVEDFLKVEMRKRRKEEVK